MTERTTPEVAVTAFEAYREVNDLYPGDSLSYEEACRGSNGDTLADFIVVELTEGVEDKESKEAQYARAIELLQRAVDDLRNVQVGLQTAHGDRIEDEEDDQS